MFRDGEATCHLSLNPFSYQFSPIQIIRRFEPASHETIIFLNKKPKNKQNISYRDLIF
jgi:hypothetical protein